jgi:hypothetical protein
VMAMVACAMYIAPDYNFNVLFIGQVKLKYVALVLIFLDLIAIADNFNAGGAFAHLGGAAFGYLYAAQLRNGVDMGKPIENLLSFFSNLFSGKSRPKMKAERGGGNNYTETRYRQSAAGNRKSDYGTTTTEGGDDQERLDAILDKIKQRGYDSLSREEKEFLFNASKK